MKAYLIIVLLAVAGITSSCSLAESLPRDNPYDLEKEDPSDYRLYVSNWEIVSESNTNDGILQEDENVFIRVWIANDGPDPVKVRTVSYSIDREWYDVSLQPGTSQELEHYTNPIVPSFVEPGGEAYTVHETGITNLEISLVLRVMPFPSNGLNTVTLTVEIMDHFFNITTESITFPVQ